MSVALPSTKRSFPSNCVTRASQSTRIDRGNGEPTGLGDGGSDDGDLGEMAVDGVEEHAAKKGPDVLRTSLRALEQFNLFNHSIIDSFI